MEHISINGEKFVKASSIARELGYTADYVGQLCRGEKVEAQLVGRSWFVSEEGLRAHKRDRYRSTASKSKEALRETKSEINTPSLRAPSHFYKGVTSSSVNYETDQEDLLPTVQEKTTKATEVPKDQKVDMQPVDEQEKQEQVSVVHEVPIRTIEPITRPKRKTYARRKIEREQATKAPVSVETSYPVSTQYHHRGTGVFVGVMCTLGIMGALAFVGLEERIVASATSAHHSYHLNLATAYSALNAK